MRAAITVMIDAAISSQIRNSMVELGRHVFASAKRFSCPKLGMLAEHRGPC